MATDFLACIRQTNQQALSACCRLIRRRLAGDFAPFRRSLELPTVDAFASVVGVERNRISGWLNGYNLPPLPLMVRLIDRPELRGLTLDWIYLGNADAVPTKLAITLTALEEGIPVRIVAEEPEPNLPGPARAKSAGRPASRKKAT